MSHTRHNKATCTGGARNGFYGAGEVNALNAVTN